MSQRANTCFMSERMHHGGYNTEDFEFILLPKRDVGVNFAFCPQHRPARNAQVQAFAHKLAVNGRNDDLAMSRWQTAIDNQHIAIVNPRPFHGGAGRTNEVGCSRRPNTQVVQRQCFFNVILSWRREAGLDRITEERNGASELLCWTENLFDQHWTPHLNKLYG